MDYKESTISQGGGGRVHKRDGEGLFLVSNFHLRYFLWLGQICQIFYRIDKFSEYFGLQESGS